MKQPLINVTRVDLKEVARHLDRIATCLELYLGMVPVGQEAVEDRANPVATYNSEEDLIREEWAKANGYVPAEDREV